MLNYIKHNLIPFLAIIAALIAIIADRCLPQDVTADFSPLKPTQTAAVYAAYSEDGTIPDYVITYLKALKEIAPNIVYITDNPIKKSELKKLAPYITHLEAKKHHEYDWGSYKRGFNWLKQHNWSPAAPETENKTIPLLILANDSTLLVAPTLAPILNALLPQQATALQHDGALSRPHSPHPDLYGITANTDGTYHLQSYFLILTPPLYNSPEFADYLNSVTKQKDGLTVAARFEVPFTAYFESLGYASKALIPYESLSSLPLNDKNCYPLTMLSKYHAPFLKMRTFTSRLNVQEPRRLVFNWLKTNAPHAYKDLITHLKHINSPYLKDNR